MKRLSNLVSQLETEDERKAKIVRKEYNKLFPQNTAGSDESSPTRGLSAPIMGIPSTMNDSYQLNIRKLMERGPIVKQSTQHIIMFSAFRFVYHIHRANSHFVFKKAKK